MRILIWTFGWSRVHCRHTRIHFTRVYLITWNTKKGKHNLIKENVRLNALYFHIKRANLRRLNWLISYREQRVSSGGSSDLTACALKNVITLLPKIKHASFNFFFFNIYYTIRSRPSGSVRLILITNRSRLIAVSIEKNINHLVNRKKKFPVKYMFCSCK